MIAPGRILVTGGSGRLGRALGRLGCYTVGRDRLDITDASNIAAMIEQTAPALVINTAAYTDVDGAEAETELAHRINAQGAGALARLCSVASIPLIHVSTDMVFSEGNPDKPVNEAAQPSPASVYGASKLEGEKQVRAAGERYCIVRVSWLFSNEGDSFISKILDAAVQRAELDLVDDEYGRPTHVDELAEHLLRLGELISNGEDVPRILHLGPGDAVSRYGWACDIFEESLRSGGPAPALHPVAGDVFPTPARRARGVVLDTTLANDLIGKMPDWRLASRACVRRRVSQRR